LTAIGALCAIRRGNRGNQLALAAGRATIEAACVEAAALLADGAAEVRIIAYDPPLPGLYTEFLDEPAAYYAWCWRVAAADADGMRLRLRWQADGCADDVSGTLPHALDLHRFLLAGDATLEYGADGRRWSWQRAG